MRFSLDEAVRSAGLTPADDVSACLPAAADDVVIDGGPYRLNAESLDRLTRVKVSGQGSVIWAGHRLLNSKNNPDPFDGIVPVSKLRDPFFLSMVLPSEAQTYMTWRVNGENMVPASKEYDQLLSIGAVYKVADAEIEDDEPITVCLGRILLLTCTGEGWAVADDQPHPAPPKALYYLPWELEHTVGVLHLPEEQAAVFDDRIEVRLTGSDLTGAPARDKGAVGTILHFWGHNTHLDGGAVKGCLVAYTAWVKEPSAVGKVAAAIGADWRAPGNPRAVQAFSGRNWLLTNEPRVILGHNVGPKAYDAVMDEDAVRALLGIR